MTAEKDFLKVPIYLNQQLIFDWIAVIEDGFSHLSSLKKSSTDKETKEKEIEGSLGISNSFSFLSASFGGKRKKGEESTELTEVTQEKIHTPNSLFSKMFKSLDAKKLILDATQSLDLNKLETGQFYLCNAILRKNPVESTFETFSQLMEMSLKFQENKAERKSIEMAANQIKSVYSQIKHAEKVEIVGEDTKEKSLKYVLSAQIDYFLNRDPNEVNDGEYFVLGKIVRILKTDSDEKINLLRKTPLASVTNELLDQMFAGFRNLETGGIKSPEIITEISGPCIQLYPIAIFV